MNIARKLAVLTLSLSALAHAAQGQVLYTATDLGDLGGGTAYGIGINNSGTVVGYSTLNSSINSSYYSFPGSNVPPGFGTTVHAFSYSGGTITDLNPGGGVLASSAQAINASGIIAGWLITATGSYHPFTYTGGTMTDLGLINGLQTEFAAINSSGDAAGSDQNFHAFIYIGGTGTSLGTLGGSRSYATGINDSDTVVGWSDTSGPGQADAFSYSGGTMTDLGTLPEGSFSSADAINNSGLIAGFSYFSNWNQAATFSGSVELLGVLGGQYPYSVANAVNSSGVVVGSSSMGGQSVIGYPVGSPGQLAVLFQDGQVLDLNTVVDLPGVTLAEAMAINDSGQIVANDDSGRAYLLTPIVAESPSFVQQSPSESVVAGQSASFTAGAVGIPAPTYQWQESTDNGSTWTNLTDGGGISGSLTATLQIAAATPGMSGYEFQVIATNTSNVVSSSPATLTVTALAGGNLVAYSFTTLAGLPPGSADGTGAAAQFDSPQGAAVDASGNIYVADSVNDTIREITPAGVVSTLAGSPGRFGSADGTGSAARFNNPTAVAVDSAGNVYVVDTNNCTIRKVTQAGVVTTLAGAAGPGQYGNSDGTGGGARFNNPRGIAVDSSGNLYVADTNNNAIRKITPAGAVTTLAGNPNQSGSTDGTGTAARFSNPFSLALDSSGNIYVADTNNETIRVVTPGGVVTTLAGAQGQRGNMDGAGAAAQFNQPEGIAVDSADNVYVADTNSHTIREITGGVVSTPLGGSYQFGSADGAGSVARFAYPQGVAVDAAGNVYVADTDNNTIRKAIAGTVATLAGTAGEIGSADGAGSTARFFFPQGVAVDAAGNVYVADNNNATIRKITPAGVVSTLAGTAFQFGDADGASNAARFNNTRGVAVDSTGNLYIADGNNTVRKITPDGFVATLAGNPTQGGSIDGTGSGAQFNNLNGVAVDLAGNVYVADSNNETIRKITPAGVVTTLAGQANQNGSNDGTGAGARFNNPHGVAVDGAGNVYVADQGNALVRKVTPSGVVTTIAGQPGYQGFVDSSGGQPLLSGPSGVAVDGAGNVYVADSNNNAIRVVSQAGVVTTLGGTPGRSGSTDALGSATLFTYPSGVAVDGAGNLYVADTWNSTIRKGTPTAVNPVAFSTQPQNTSVTAGQNTSFTVAAIGTAPVAYQWQIQTVGSAGWTNLSDGGEFSGTSTATLSITGATDDLNQAQFQCVLSNGGFATSNLVTLTVNFPPALEMQSPSTTAIAGQSVSFSVGVTGSPAPAYQWQVSTDNGSTWTNLSDGGGFVGTGTATLGIAAASGSQSGSQFRMVATNGSGVFTSTPVTLTVTAVPGGDLVAYDFTTLAGQAPGSANGTGAAAQFNNPESVAVDGSGNAYVADSWNDTIRKITPAGVVTTLAGSPFQTGYADGTEGAARFNQPAGVAADASGNVYVADGSSTIRKITPAGVVTTLAGSAYQNGNQDGTGGAAQFNNPRGVAVDGSGTVYVADSNNNTIRKVTPAGVVTTLAGSPYQNGNVDATGSAAQFFQPQGVAVDSNGYVYVADRNNCTIRKITPGGAVTTLAGTPGISGNPNGTGSAAQFANPQGVAVDAAGNVYVADTNNNAIRMITPGGVVTTLAGMGGFGNADGTGGFAQFDNPQGIASDPSGNLYVADTQNNTIRAVSPGGVVTTLAGTPRIYGADGTGSAAAFTNPGGTAVDLAGNVYVADTNNAIIRKITPAGVVTTLAGTLDRYGSTDGTGSGAQFNHPMGIALDLGGNVYVADDGANTIRKITPAGVVTTLAGNPFQNGSADGTGSSAQFNNPQSVAVDEAGNVYVADSNNQTIRKVTPNGSVTTLAGVAGQYGNSDGSGPNARFNYPQGVAVDSAGNLYVADRNNNTIREISPGGNVSTLAGNPFRNGNSDGTGSNAQFNNPQGVAVDGAGNVYVTDGNNNSIRMVTQAGVVTTIAGVAGHPGIADGLGSGVRFSWPIGVAVDGAGNLYVGDTNNNTIRKGVPTVVTPVSITMQPEDAEIPVGQNATFTVAASGTAPFDYQWQIETLGSSVWTSLSDSGEFSGSSTATLSITGATVDLDQAQFQCVVSNGTTATTVPATLSVDFLPVIELQSPGASAIAGQSVSFSIGVAAGPSASFQWQESLDGGATWTNLGDGNGFSGTATDTLDISAVSGSQSGDKFRVTATNGSGSVTSAAMSLTVAVPSGGQLVAYDFTTFAGLAPGSADGTGGDAQFDNPIGTAVDSAGNVYVADSWNETIRKITPEGVVTTLAGAAGQFGSADGTGSAARFNQPQGLAVDSSGNLYVADTSSNTIRKVSPAGVVTTLAGSPYRNGNSDGTGGAAQFSYPRGVAVDGSGNVYVADSNNHTIRKISPGGVVTTLAGMPNQSGSSDGTGSAARFNYPSGLVADAAGNVFVADTNNQTIRMIATNGAVTTLAGSPNQGGNSDGTGGAARFSNPEDVAVDAADNVYVVDTNNDIVRMITPSGVVTTLAGTSNQWGSADGTGAGARFGYPAGIAADASGDVFVADSSNQTIRAITPAGVVTTLAGSPGEIGSEDGPGSDARFYSPQGVAVDFSGTVYVADGNNETIRKITPAGVVSTVAGAPFQYGNQDGTGSSAQINNPRGVAADSVGNLFVVDGNNTIRKITPAGVVTTLAGDQFQWGSADGTGTAAQFNNPQGIAVDLVGNLYVADTNSGTIRKVSPAGVVTTLAGTPNQNGNSDGTGGAAQFNNPAGVAVDVAGNVYVADRNNNTIRKVTPGGVVTTLAGNPFQSGNVDGTGGAATFNGPEGVAVDGAGNVYVADAYNQTIRMVTPAGVVTTLGGMPRQSGGADGFGDAAKFGLPHGIAVDGAGNIYVADMNNNNIRKGTPAAVNPASVTSQPQNATVSAGQNTSFTVSVTGTAPFSYQWQMLALGSSTWTDLVDGGEFSGTDSATLSITGATADLNQAQFQCVILNGGEATSNAVTLTVNYAPTIVLQSPSAGALRRTAGELLRRRELPAAPPPTSGRSRPTAVDLVEPDRRQRLRGIRDGAPWASPRRPRRRTCTSTGPSCRTAPGRRRAPR